MNLDNLRNRIKRLELIIPNVNNELNYFDEISEDQLNQRLDSMMLSEARKYFDITQLYRDYKLFLESIRNDLRLSETKQFIERLLNNPKEFYDLFVPYFQQAWAEKGKDFRLFVSYESMKTILESN